jgi:hypothetical protein
LPVLPRSPDQWLANLDGFEIVNEGKRARIKFPRRW